MSTGSDAHKSYDLRKMEDIFSCLEIITMARGILYPVDANMAARLEKVSDALSAFSMVVDEAPIEPAQNLGGSEQKTPPKEQSSPDLSPETDSEPLDLLSDLPQKGNGTGGKGPAVDGDDGIIDILTGEKIR